MRMRNEANGGSISSRMDGDMRDMRGIRDMALQNTAGAAAIGTSAVADAAPHDGATATGTATGAGTGTGTGSSQQRKGPCKRKHRHWGKA